MGLGRILGLGPRSGPVPATADRKAVRRLVSQCHELLSERGGMTGVALANQTLSMYQSLDEAGRRAFFKFLIRDFSPDPEEVGRAADAYRRAPNYDNLQRLQDVVEPPRQELFRRLNLAKDGTRGLVQMRKDALREIDAGQSLEPIASDLGHLLASWFNRGFLTLQRIDWRSPAALLQKLIEYEAVHQIQGWNDLRRRLEGDRRCYAFFHSALPEDPLIFIEVALTRGISDRVQPLLDPQSPVHDPEGTDTAIFYSITNCQDGLRGVPFGSLLIKQVVEDLKKNLPRLRTFATLSPIPGFRKWLAAQATEGQPAAGQGNAWEPGKADHQTRQRVLGLCAQYLLHAKRGAEPLDPVARFHLKNGARLDRINWDADTSPSGIKQSGGLMANYVYDLEELGRNHEMYVRSGQIACSRRVRILDRAQNVENNAAHKPN